MSLTFKEAYAIAVEEIKTMTEQERIELVKEIVAEQQGKELTPGILLMLQTVLTVGRGQTQQGEV